MRKFSKIAGAGLAALVIAVGTAWAFERGAKDFSVFYEAWRLVLTGHGSDIYRVSPDRFLYAPGFAWLLSPLGLLPRNISLLIWCLMKAAVVAFVALSFGGTLESLWAVVLLARPLLIDFQYGQVNTLILGACVAALMSHHSRSQSHVKDTALWGLCSIAAIASGASFRSGLPWRRQAACSR